MQGYRRNLVPGGTYFFTVNLLHRSNGLLVEHVATLRAAVRAVRTRRPFEIDAWVVLPDHMHCIWTLPPGDSDYPARWRDIKSIFSRDVGREPAANASRQKKGEHAIWQRRYWEHTIRDDRDFAAHADYIHFNPVKHGHVARVADWPFSSFHRSVAAGLYPAEWGNEALAAEEGDFGERQP